MPLPPTTVDPGGMESLWPGFVLSGLSGGVSATILGAYTLQGDLDPEYSTRYFTKDGGSMIVRQDDEGAWQLVNSGGDVILYQADASDYPWTGPMVPDAAFPMTGTAVFTRRNVAPVVVDVGGGEATEDATLDDPTVSPANSRGLFISAIPGRAGNSIRYRQVNPGAPNVTASVTVSGLDVTVTLGTNGSGTLVTTGNQRNTLINSSPAASQIMSASNYPGNDGTGISSAFAFTSFSGGTGGLPPAPVQVSVS